MVDDDLRQLVRDMVETTHAEPGVGLAANQVGRPLRLMVVDPSAGEDPSQLRVLLNLKVLETAGSQTDEEGCLSFPGIFEAITRPKVIRFSAQDLDLNPIEGTAEDYVARVILHELDHLDGKTFLGRMSPLKRRLVQRRIERMQREGEWVSPAAAAS